MKLRYFLFLVFGLFLGCKEKPKTEAQTSALPASAVFNEDSAHAYITAQVGFGPRIVNSAAHNACASYLVKSLKNQGFLVTEQNFKTQKYDGTALNAVNIIGSLNPTATKRILLAAHWDTRSQSDKDPSQKTKKFDGANDGASGVGVLLEVARALKVQKLNPNLGVDIIFFDAEDDGELNDGPSAPLKNGLESWWCLGSQYWSKNKHVPNYTAYYGILLDMVGAADAQFAKDTYSVQYAGSIANSIWDTAAQLGHAKYFVQDEGGGVTDDHVFVNMHAKIPMVDIIDYRPHSEAGFGAYHHAQTDNIAGINKATLKAVGQTVLQMLAIEAEGL
jgi:glutaminyl-peptide cyclotransferase